MTLKPQISIINKEDIPVLLTIFNRPEKTKAVIDNLRLIKPKMLFVAADGPRLDHQEDYEKCSQAREIALGIDWSCDIKTRFLKENMGVDPAVSTAIEWFFQNVEYGIILEDDCIVHPHFFEFCAELLLRYADDERIMQISSLSPYEAREHTYDYHFSRIFRCSGGWSTWRRAWKHYTFDMRVYGDKEALQILKAYHPEYSKCLWQYRELLKHKKRNLLEYQRCSSYYWDHWDFQWNLACASQNGLCIVPENNFMNNIGFDEDSTHTTSMIPTFENLRMQPIQFPLRHPHFIYADSQPERWLEKRSFRSLPLKSRCMYLLRRALGALSYLREVMPYR